MRRPFAAIVLASLVALTACGGGDEEGGTGGPSTAVSPETRAAYVDAMRLALASDRDELGLSDEQVDCLAGALVDDLAPTWLDAAMVTPDRVVPLDETFTDQPPIAFLAPALMGTPSGRILRTTILLSEPTARTVVAGIDGCIPLADLWVRAFTKDSGFGANQAACLQEQLDTTLLTDLLVLGLTLSEQEWMLQGADPTVAPPEAVQRFRDDLPRLAEACGIDPDLLRYFFS